MFDCPFGPDVFTVRIVNRRILLLAKRVFFAYTSRKFDLSNPCDIHVGHILLHGDDNEWFGFINIPLGVHPMDWSPVDGGFVLNFREAFWGTCMMNSTEYAAGQPVILHKMGGVGGMRDVSIPLTPSSRCNRSEGVPPEYMGWVNVKSPVSACTAGEKNMLSCRSTVDLFIRPKCVQN